MILLIIYLLSLVISSYYIERDRSKLVDKMMKEAPYDIKREWQIRMTISAIPFLPFVNTFMAVAAIYIFYIYNPKNN